MAVDVHDHSNDANGGEDLLSLHTVDFCPTIITISSGTITRTRSYHYVAAESGTEDELVTINGGSTGHLLYITPDTGDTITVKHGTGNIHTATGEDEILNSGAHLFLIYNSSAGEWIASQVTEQPINRPMTTPELLLTGICPITPISWEGTRADIRAALSGAIHIVPGWQPNTRALVIEEGVTNLCENPSAETNTTGWSPGGGSLTRSTDCARFGDYSLKKVTTDGTYNGLDYDKDGILTAETSYTASLWVKGDPNVGMIWTARNNDDTSSLAQIAFTPTGQWQRVSVTFTTEAGQTNLHMMLRKDNDATITTFYADGLQIEQNVYATTYCDGDQGHDYAWSGTAHASSSVRTATRAILDSYSELISGNNILSFRCVVQVPYDWDDPWTSDNVHYIFDARGADNDNRIILRYNSSTDYFSVYINGSDRLVSNTPSFSAGDWVDIIATLDFGNDEYKLYIDGVLEDTDTTSLAAPTITDWVIGSAYNSAANAWCGAVAEYALFNNILTAEQVRRLHIQGHSVDNMAHYDPSVITCLSETPINSPYNLLVHKPSWYLVWPTKAHSGDTNLAKSPNTITGIFGQTGAEGLEFDEWYNGVPKCICAFMWNAGAVEWTFDPGNAGSSVKLISSYDDLTIEVGSGKHLKLEPQGVLYLGGTYTDYIECKQGIKLYVGSSFGTASTGMMYFDSDDGKVTVYDGSNWKKLKYV